MNILVSCMGYDSGKSGISTYMNNVLSNFKDAPHSITLILEYDSVEKFKNYNKIIVPRIFSKSLMGMLWHFFVLPFYTLRKKYDCILILAASRRYLAFSKIPQIGVIHDLSPCRIEKKYDPIRMFYLRKLQPWLGKRIDEIVAISQSTKDDIVRYWGIIPEKITLNYNGLTKLEEPDEHIQNRLDLKKYILYISRIEHPGKNHLGLIKAYESLPSSIRDEYKLVLAGSNWKGAEAVRDYANRSSEAERIIFTGFVSPAELSGLYRQASIFVFPSFSEGFGLPLLEAMSSSVPCACANNTSLGEIAGDAALLFDPKRNDQISDCILQILSNRNLSDNLIQKGIARSKQFNWNNHSLKLLSLCKKTYDKNSYLKIFGVRFLNGRMDEIIRTIDEIIYNKKKKKIAFINAHYLNTAYEDPEQINRLNRFDYVLPDGCGVSLTCKMLGYRYRENLNGTDLLPLLCKLFEQRGYTMYFFGSADTVAERAAKNLSKKYPSLKIIGFRNGFFNKNEEDSIIFKINKLSPDLLIVGFGAKLQEKWIDEHFDRLNCRVVAAMGGVLDFYSGDAPRAHPLLRKIGLEWAWRLYIEPKRLAKRYLLGNPLFLYRVAKSLFSPSKKED